MMIKALFVALALIAGSNAAAEIQIQTTCYAGDSRPNSKVYVKPAVRTYTDTETKKEIGAFAQYNNGKSAIPLVFVKSVLPRWMRWSWVVTN